MKLLLATQNKDKVKELTYLLKDLDIELFSSSDFPDMKEVIEDKETLEGNAEKKAVETAKFTGMYCIADDTGLFIQTLNNEPGVHSARYGGEDCSYADNRKKVLERLNGVSSRDAFFRTVVVIADPKGEIVATADGKVGGVITTEEIGKKGFGYDSIFLCDETGLTFGEMTEESKSKISHRGRAFRNIYSEIIKLKNAEDSRNSQ